MSKYSPDGLRIATDLFEAAAWHRAVKPVCGRCHHTATFNSHALWWHFDKRGWDIRLRQACERFWCRECAKMIGKRVRPRVLDLVAEAQADIRLTMPPEAEWKRAINRFRS